MTEETTATQASKPKSPKKATSSRQSAKGAAGKKRVAGKGKEGKNAPQRAAEARENSKAAQVLDLLRRPDGATLAELMKATDWQAHSVRGFLSGTVRKKLALTIESSKIQGGERRYSIQA